MTENETETTIPSIERIEYDAFAEDHVVSDDHREVSKGERGDEFGTGEDDANEIRIVLESGAMLNYEWRDEKTVTEKIYRPQDVGTGVWDTVDIDLHHGGVEDFLACVQNSVEAYEGGAREDYELFRGEE